MEINRHNYEAFLLDLLEGNLPVEDQKHVHDFLRLNPDCAIELTDIEPWVLAGEELRFRNKAILKKDFPDSTSRLSNQNFDLISVARMEGDLSPEQESAYQAMISSDDLKYRQWLEWQQTRLPTGKLEFKGKELLKRKEGPKRRMQWISVVSTAAALALLFVLFRTGPNIPPQQQAMQETRDLVSQDAALQNPVPQDPATQDPAPQDLSSPQASAVSVLTSSESLMQKSKNAVLFSVRKEHLGAEELGSKMTEIHGNDFNTRLQPGAARRITAISPVVEAVPDRIEALYVPPVPVHLSSLTVAQIYDMDLQEVLVDYTREKDISLLSIANAGIKGINKLAGSDLTLLASRDEDGDVSGFLFKGKRFSLTKPIGRED